MAYEIYYLGGPWDLTKRVMPSDRPNGTVHRVAYSLDRGVAGSAEIQMGEVEYELRMVARNYQAGRDVWIGVFAGWQS